MPAKPTALVLCGDGINCERETAHALDLAGFSSTIRHVNSVMDDPGHLRQAKLVALPGGFSFGDEIASGKVLSVKLRHRALASLHDFIDGGNLVVGICNGFQVLVQLGLLPDSDRGARRAVSLLHNSGGRFINRWVELDVSPQAKGPFFSGLTGLHLPIRHGEGRLAVGAGPASEEAVRSLVPLRYREDVNGSFERAAGLTNRGGNVLGLMPHPEAFVRWSQHPAHAFWRRAGRVPAAGLHPPDRFPHGCADGLVILQNARRSLD